MKPLKTLLYLLLIPFALFLTSCENEIPEEFVIEIDPYSAEGPYGLDDVDYFTLELYKLSEVHEDEDEVPPVFQGRLNKGDVLRLGDLEPGLYSLSGEAYKYTGNEWDPWQLIGNVYGISDKMESRIVSDIWGQSSYPVNYLVIDEFSPTVVKLVVSFTGA